MDFDENGTILLDDLHYRDVTANLLITAERKRLVVTPRDFEDPIVAFQTKLSGLVGLATTTLASSFLDSSINQDGSVFRLIGVQPSGDLVTFAPSQPPTVATALPDDTLKTSGPSFTLIGLGLKRG